MDETTLIKLFSNIPVVDGVGCDVVERDPIARKKEWIVSDDTLNFHLRFSYDEILKRLYITLEKYPCNRKMSTAHLLEEIRAIEFGYGKCSLSLSNGDHVIFYNMFRENFFV